MSEEIQLPPLPEGMSWEVSSPFDGYWKIKQGWLTSAMVGKDKKVLIWTWRNQCHWIEYLGAKTQQEALNHAAALLFLGEADE